MKKSFLLLVSAILIGGYVSNAQQPVNKDPRYIDVSGSADIEVVPDEIYLSITLTEYEKKGQKINIDAIDRKFSEVITTMKISKDNLALENAAGGMHWRRRKPDTFLASKTYRLKLSTMAIFDELLDKLDEIGITNVSIQDATHSQMKQYRLKVREEALKAAQKKAEAMLAAIGEAAGKVLFINEVNTDGYYPMPMYGGMRMKSMSNSSMDMAESNPASDIDFKKIKIRGEVNARFEIK